MTFYWPYLWTVNNYSVLWRPEILRRIRDTGSSQDA